MIIINRSQKAADSKHVFRETLDALVNRILRKECLFVFMNATARVGSRKAGGGESGDKELGAYERNELIENGKRLLTFAATTKLALTNTFFSTRRWGLAYIRTTTSAAKTSVSESATSLSINT